MTIQASIVADSINPSDNRLTTWLLRYPRSIHAEVLTHRAFSRNSASSRAIPIETMIQRVLDDPFIPKWTTAQKGMVEGTMLEERRASLNEISWLHARDEAVGWARLFADQGVAKSIVNRLLEPWMHIEVVLSATEWRNWYALRDDPAAEPHIRDLAHTMKELHATNEPVFREGCGTPNLCHYVGKVDTLTASSLGGTTPESVDCWHLPFIKDPPRQDGYNKLYDTIKESVAHAAWVSYGNASGREGFTQDDVSRVYDKLVGSAPIHASPTEHVAVACSAPHRHGNFTGWCQWRKFLPGESGGDYN